mmetsp:Transcript_21134/g.40069  ORF Transcript_21134/g.40069 Transcript_21134/m.40069 type:complete len:126 (+) Transcript_21134:1269-1646(+)
MLTSNFTSCKVGEEGVLSTNFVETRTDSGNTDGGVAGSGGAAPKKTDHLHPITQLRDGRGRGLGDVGGRYVREGRCGGLEGDGGHAFRLRGGNLAGDAAGGGGEHHDVGIVQGLAVGNAMAQRAG